MDKIYFTKDSNSNIELVENSRMKPNYLNTEEKVFRLNMQIDFNKAFNIYLDSEDVSRLIKSIEDTISSFEQSKFISDNLIEPDEAYKYSSHTIKCRHNRILKLDIIPYSSGGKLTAITFIPYISYKLFLFKIKYRYIKIKNLTVSMEDINRILHCLKELND